LDSSFEKVSALILPQFPEKGKKNFQLEFQPKAFGHLCVFLHIFGRITKRIEKQSENMVYFTQGFRNDPILNK